MAIRSFWTATAYTASCESIEFRASRIEDLQVHKADVDIGDYYHQAGDAEFEYNLVHPCNRSSLRSWLYTVFKLKCSYYCRIMAAMVPVR